MTGKPAFLLVARTNTRQSFRVAQLIMIFFLLWSSPAISSAIKAVTLGPIAAIRGDIVSLSVEPVDQASTIEWWVEGDVVCQKAQCDVDTNRFTPGEYTYYVVVRSSIGVEIAEVGVSAELAPPLYKPIKRSSDRVGPNKKLAFVANGEWLLIPRFGLVGASRKSNSNKISATGFAEKLVKGQKYRVGAGGSAILRRVGHLEEWILDENTFFMLDDGGVSLLSGSGVWRKMKHNDKAVSRSKIYGVTVEAMDDQVILARPGDNKKSAVRVEIINLQGPAVGALCAGEIEIRLPPKSQLNLEKSVVCKIENPWPRGLAAFLLSRQFPNWSNKKDSVMADRWRAESEAIKLMEPLEKSADAAVNQAFEAGICSDVLDITGAMSAIQGSFLMKRARCQLMFGLGDDALRNFKSLESAEFDPALTALMLARTYYQLDDVTKALEWYKKAYDRGYQDRSGLSREAVGVARAAGLARDHLAWLDSIVLNEEEPQRLSEAQRGAGSFRESRSKGAEIGAGVFMDSQAVPINSKEIESMPNKMSASRAAIGDFRAAWWRNHSLTEKNRLATRGRHSVRWPTGAKQAPFTITQHDLKIGLISEITHTGAAELAGQWFLQPSAVIGTGSLGPSRARDRYGWEFDISYVGERTYSLTLMSDKYLDPNPDDSKYVDIDLYRYTGSGDFSHFDFVFRGQVFNPGDAFSWGLSFDYGSSDYRTLSFSNLDHDLLRVEFDSHVILSRAVMAQIRPRYERLNYKKSSKVSSEASLDGIISWRFMPLWAGRINMAYQARDIEGDAVGSWNRLVYGLSVVTDL